MRQNMTVMALAAHPDDIELGCGGTMIKLGREGVNIVIADGTKGELGTRGTEEIREKEAEDASRIMGVSARINLGMEDGNIELSKENKYKVISALRRYRPDIIICTPEHERHPDHENMNRIVRAAAFLSGLKKIETEFEGKKQEPHRPKRMFCFMQTYEFKPDLYVDVSDTFDMKMEAIKAYSSQFYLPQKYRSDEPETFISRPGFLEMIESRARYFGEKIGVKYAEAFYSVEPIGVESLSVFL